MLIGHLTDLHAVAEGQTLGGRVDTNRLAELAVESVNSAAYKPEFVVVTGDLTHQGKPAQMQVARRILDGLSSPYFVLPGAHDDTEVFWQVFGDLPYLKDGGEARYCVDEFDVRLIAVDTTRGKGAPPDFGDGRGAWLREQLASAPQRPTVIAMHHPPFQCRIPVATYVKDQQVSWANGLKGIVADFPNVKLILCGHVHRSIQTLWAGAMVSVCPATCVQAEPKFGDLGEAVTDRRATSLVLEPPAYQVHWWDGLNFATFTLPTESFERI
jgi:3',5'-cyclic AMP phosphodiesterase CpdA